MSLEAIVDKIKFKETTKIMASSKEHIALNFNGKLRIEFSGDTKENRYHIKISYQDSRYINKKGNESKSYVAFNGWAIRSASTLSILTESKMFYLIGQDSANFLFNMILSKKELKEILLALEDWSINANVFKLDKNKENTQTTQVPDLEKEIKALKEKYLLEFDKELERLHKSTNEQILKEKEKLKLWQPKKDEEYLCFNSCFDIISDVNNFFAMDLDRIKVNNYFETFEEAQYSVNYLKLALKIIKYKKLVNEGWKPDWNDSKSEKQVIYCLNGAILECPIYKETHPLAFKDAKARSLFREYITDQEIKDFLKF